MQGSSAHFHQPAPRNLTTALWLQSCPKATRLNSGPQLLPLLTSHRPLPKYWTGDYLDWGLGSLEPQCWERVLKEGRSLTTGE